MRIVVQRVSEASVTVEGKITGKIGKGFLLLVGICDEDSEETVKKMADKVTGLRIFTDSQDKMNLSLQQVDGSVLSISQFTLFADCHKGTRPSFSKAGSPEHAERLYKVFNETVRQKGYIVEEGIFGADMKVRLLNDGPVTIILDSKEMWGI